MIYTDDLVKRIKAFLEKSGMSPTAMGRQMLKDPNKINDIINGRESPNMRTADKIVALMETYDAR